MFMHMHTSMSVFICTIVGQVRSENVSSCELLVTLVVLFWSEEFLI